MGWRGDAGSGAGALSTGCSGASADYCSAGTVAAWDRSRMRRGGGVLSDGDEWATLDELLGMEALADQSDGGGIGRLAFYGRCSTEDNQDPATPKAWQLGEAQRFVEPLGGEVVEEFFDIGQSRSLPWERRTEANEVLRALKNPQRGWDGLVVGEASRCWFSNQFSLTWPKFDRYGVSLSIPSLGGRFDPENTVHDMAMTITGWVVEVRAATCAASGSGGDGRAGVD